MPSTALVAKQVALRNPPQARAYKTRILLMNDDTSGARSPAMV
jgi:hypothetical protein